MPHHTANEFYRLIAPRYKQYRPRYPEALFRYLASLTPQHETAWDCATGSGGQAARGLTAHFNRVIATDAVNEQVAIADPYPGVEFRCAPAEESGLDAASVNLVTVAQALHWFDLDRFYAEVQRVVVPGGVIAAWCYLLPVIDEGQLDRLVADLFDATCLGDYWPSCRRHVDDGYQSLPFPFRELPSHRFTAEENWTLDSLVGYLHTWQALTDSQDDPAAVAFVAAQTKRIAATWRRGKRARRRVQWTLELRVGQLPG